MSESTEDTYIKRIQFYMLLMIQTAVVAMFIATDHAAIVANERAIEQLRSVDNIVQEFKAFKEGMIEFKTWAGKTADASVADRASLRMEILKANELRYNIQQCTDEIKNLKEGLKEHEKETASYYKKAPQTSRDN